MKIRTIVGLLLVFALVLGSTGIGAAGYGDYGWDNGNGEGDELRDGSCQEDTDVSALADQDRVRDCDNVCDPVGDEHHNGWHK